MPDYDFSSYKGWKVEILCANEDVSADHFLPTRASIALLQDFDFWTGVIAGPFEDVDFVGDRIKFVNEETQMTREQDHIFRMEFLPFDVNLDYKPPGFAGLPGSNAGRSWYAAKELFRLLRTRLYTWLRFVEEPPGYGDWFLATGNVQQWSLPVEPKGKQLRSNRNKGTKTLTVEFALRFPETVEEVYLLGASS